MTDLLTQLAAPFPPESVSWRVGSTTKDKSKGMALAYIDARDVMNRLDAVCGPFGWQNEHIAGADGKKLTCRIGIRDPETKEWVWKSDGAGETDVEGEKGSYSDSLKRAAVAWGIGRYLYNLDSPWVALEPRGNSYVIPDGEKAKLRAVLAKGAQNQAAPAKTNGASHSPKAASTSSVRLPPDFFDRESYEIPISERLPASKWDAWFIAAINACGNEDTLSKLVDDNVRQRLTWEKSANAAVVESVRQKLVARSQDFLPGLTP